MATILYKDGQEGRFDASRVQAMLESGWSVTMEVENAEAQEAPTKEEADTNKTGKLSSNEVRQAAKKAGIKGWKTARIQTLKGLLGYDQG